MAISDKIKQHRKRLGITQRELAETLGVSVQAISKWETGNGIPDVSALIPLARELHITTDELLDFHDRRQELEKLWHKTLMTYGDGSKEVYDWTCEALKEFPKDETFLYRRAVEARFLYENTDKGDPDRNAWFRKHHAQLLSVMGLYPEWDWPISEMVYLLVAADRKHDAIVYAKRAVKEEQDMLLKLCLEGEELLHLRQVRVEKMFRDLLNELRCDDRVFLDIEEQLIQTVIPDGNYLYYFDLLMMIEMKRAEISVTEKEYDRALIHLEKAFAYARKEDASPSGKFTCHLFDTIPFRNYKEADHPSLAEQFRFILTNNKLLSVLEHRNAYQRLIRQVDACIQYGEKGLYPVKDTDETTFPLSEFLDLMEIAKTDMEASEQLAMSEALVMETVNGSIYRTLVTDPLPYATDAVSEMVQTMKAQGNIEIKRLVCYRQDGFFVMPEAAVLRILCALHRNNAEAPLLLSGNSGLLKRKIKETFPSYLQKFLYCKPDAADLFETEEYDGKSCEDLLCLGQQILTEYRQNGTLSNRAEIVLLRTSKGNTYYHYDSDFSTATHEALIDELIDQRDTYVTHMVCMGANGGLDLGKFRLRDRLFDLDERNGGTKILLQGFDNLHFRTLFSCFSSHKLANISRQNELNIRIKRLERERIEDYLSFFDRVSSNSLLCYCTNFHRTQDEVDTFFKSAFDGGKAMMEFARNEGKQFALEGRIQGYLVYCDDEVVGWCQAKDKTSYRYLGTGVPIDADKAGEVIGISCLVIDDNHRGRGIGSALLEYVANEERNRGYKYLEAYPSRGCLWNDAIFDDMIRLYEKQGFVTVVKRDDWRIIQKELCPAE